MQPSLCMVLGWIPMAHGSTWKQHSTENDLLFSMAAVTLRCCYIAWFWLTEFKLHCDPNVHVLLYFSGRTMNQRGWPSMAYQRPQWPWRWHSPACSHCGKRVGGWVGWGVTRATERTQLLTHLPDEWMQDHFLPPEGTIHRTELNCCTYICSISKQEICQYYTCTFCKIGNYHYLVK